MTSFVSPVPAELGQSPQAGPGHVATLGCSVRAVRPGSRGLEQRRTEPARARPRERRGLEEGGRQQVAALREGPRHAARPPPRITQQRSLVSLHDSATNSLPLDMKPETPAPVEHAYYCGHFCNSRVAALQHFKAGLCWHLCWCLRRAATRMWPHVAP